MDSAIVLRMRALDALNHLAWLEPQIFRGQRPREGPISNKNLGRRAEKPHLGHVGYKKRGDLGGSGPPRDFDHLVEFAAEFLQSKRASFLQRILQDSFQTIFSGLNFQDPFPLE